MLKQLEEPAQKFLQGSLKQHEFVQAVLEIMQEKRAALGPLRDHEVVEFAKRLAHFS